MNYLFIDASENSTTAQIGFSQNHVCKSFATDRNLAALITDVCDQMLAMAGFNFNQLDLLAVCTGPGSLTGLRVAAGFMRTLAMLGKKPLAGIDIFTWSLQTLQDQGHSGNVRLVQPTLIDKAFEVRACLPEICFDKPRLIDKAGISNETATYAIRGQIPGLQVLHPTDSALHKLLNRFDCTKPSTFSDILEVLPMYVIPSQAERKFEEKQ